MDTLPRTNGEMLDAMLSGLEAAGRQMLAPAQKSNTFPKREVWRFLSVIGHRPDAYEIHTLPDPWLRYWRGRINAG